MGDTASVPALPQSPVARDVVKDIAMDIGAAVRDYIEYMYPETVKAGKSSFLISLKHSIYNEIINALTETDEAKIHARLAERKAWRRRFKKEWKQRRNRDYEAIRAAADVTPTRSSRDD